MSMNENRGPRTCPITKSVARFFMNCPTAPSPSVPTPPLPRVSAFSSESADMSDSANSGSTVGSICSQLNGSDGGMSSSITGDPSLNASGS